MNRNSGTVDRFVRIVLGLALFALAFIEPHTWIWLVALVPLVTGVVGYCPVYHLFGWNFRKPAGKTTTHASS
jgi:fatty acid desaturase